MIKGPAAVLYGLQASLAGTIMKTTRVPLYQRQTTFNFRMDEWGGYRIDLDQTGPLAQFGASKLAYRIDLAQMGGGSFYKNDGINRQSAFGVIELRTAATTVRMSGTYLYSRHRPHQNTFVTPEGVPSRGREPE